MFLLWVLRFFAFSLYESPKYLVGRGRDAEAVAVIQKVAAYNGQTSSLTLEHLQTIDDCLGSRRSTAPGGGLEAVEKREKNAFDTSAKGVIMRKLEVFSGEHIRALFATRKLAWSTSLLIVLWGTLMEHQILPFVYLAHVRL